MRVGAALLIVVLLVPSVLAQTHATDAAGDQKTRDAFTGLVASVACDDGQTDLTAMRFTHDASGLSASVALRDPAATVSCQGQSSMLRRELGEVQIDILGLLGSDAYDGHLHSAIVVYDWSDGSDVLLRIELDAGRLPDGSPVRSLIEQHVGQLSGTLAASIPKSGTIASESGPLPYTTDGVTFNVFGGSFASIAAGSSVGPEVFHVSDDIDDVLAG